MRPSIAGVLALVVVAVGLAVGIYLAVQTADGTTAAQEGTEKPGSTPDAVIQQWLAEGTVPPALAITPVPTCPPEPPTPTPIPGEQSTYWPVTPAPQPCIPADQPAPPMPTPDPSWFTRPEEPEPSESIDLSKPVPCHVPLREVGEATVYLPVGSTHKLRINEYLPGMPRGPVIEDIIERGRSRVVIDSETGEITGWNVAPEDEADFRRLILEPLQGTPYSGPLIDCPTGHAP